MMINGMQLAIVKKDIKGITSNRRLFSAILIVPLIMVVLMPSAFILPILLDPSGTSGLEQLAPLIGETAQSEDLEHMAVAFILNAILPLFFLMIPIISSSVMAASAFVGEKEKSTLETLLYCPLPLKSIFSAKIMASFLLSMAVSLLSFIIMMLVVQTEFMLIAGSLFMPGVSWLIMVLLVSPAISLIAINLIVRGSAKAQTMEESQQRSVFLILPIIVLLMGQFTGIMQLSAWLFLATGLILALIALLMLKSSFGKFQYEKLLR